MTIASEITRLNNAKAAIKQSLTNKGVEVSDSALLDEYPALIDSIPMEGGNPYYEDLYNLRTNNGTDMTGLFAYCPASKLDLRSLDTSKITNMQYMFAQCNSLSSINIDGWDTSNVTNMSNMFYFFIGSVDISKLDTSSLTDVNNMFSNANTDKIILTGLSFPKATKLDHMFNSARGTTLDLSSWDISNITSMSNMFACEHKKIDLTGWKTTNVTNMSSTFYKYNSPLEELIIPDWDMTNVTSSSSFFHTNMPNLKLIDLSRSNDATITKIASFLPTRTATTFGTILVPENISQATYDALIAKYWRPMGAAMTPAPTSYSIVAELDEILPGKSTKVYFGACEPWNADASKAEIVLLSDSSIATMADNEVTSTGTGNIELAVRLIDTQEIIGTKTIVVSETDSYPNLVKFRAVSTPGSYAILITVNGSGKKLSDLTYDSYADVYSYDAGVPITKIQISYNSNISELIKLNTSNITNMERMFAGCGELVSVNSQNWDTGNVTNTGWMFQNCSKLVSLDLSNWDLTNTPNAGSIFQGCNALHTLRLDNCSNDTINKLINSTAFPTNAIEGVTRTIYCKEENAAGLVAPTNWVFSYIVEEPEEPDIPLYVSGQFSNKGDITEVKTMVNDTHTSLNSMFSYCYNLASIIGIEDWDTSNVTNMGRMFTYCAKLITLDLSSFDTSKVTDMEWMFMNCSNLTTLDLSNFDMTNVTNYASMFSSCYELHTLRLDNCDHNTISKITSTIFNYPVEGLTRKIYCKEANAAGLTAPNGWVFVDYMTGEEIVPEMPEEPEEPEEPEVPDVPLYVSGEFKNKSEITEVNTIVNSTHTNLANMFDCCFNLATVNTQDWDTSNVTTMRYMFNYCHKLTSLDLSSFDTSKVTDMNCMFYNCSNLTTVDLSNFDTTNVTNLMGMFGSCYELRTLRLDNCSNATISKIVNSSNLPTGTVNGITRIIYCKEANASGLTAPNGWGFVFVD